MESKKCDFLSLFGLIKFNKIVDVDTEKNKEAEKPLEGRKRNLENLKYNSFGYKIPITILKNNFYLSTVLDKKISQFASNNILSYEKFCSTSNIDTFSDTNSSSFSKIKNKLSKHLVLRILIINLFQSSLKLNFLITIPNILSFYIKFLRPWLISSR